MLVIRELSLTLVLHPPKAIQKTHKYLNQSQAKHPVALVLELIRPITAMHSTFAEQKEKFEDAE